MIIIAFFTTTNYVNNFLSYSKDSSKLYDVIYSSYIDDNNITKDNIFLIILNLIKVMYLLKLLL
ncbi:MAG: hypothetical protein L6V91_03075 [Bacilli bacterium]|nr:MAG: hypothetical protein L6V91_03075 [Bacilli bacterium]